MKELLAILEACADLDARNEPAVLATVVQVSGSTYRRPGARMLAARSGRRVGSISGGCLEGDVAERAWKLTEPAPDGSPRAAVMTYDAAANDDALWGFGLGCNGVVHVLVERTATHLPVESRPPTDPITFMRRCVARDEAGVIATVFRVEGDPGARAGARLLLGERDDVADDLGRPALRRAVLEDARRCLTLDQPVSRTYQVPGGRVEVLVEPVERPLPLVVFGAGHDAVPVVSAAKALGWHVTLVDRRSAFASRAHFPSADAVVVCRADEVRGRVRLGPRTAAVVMTHNYLDDQALLEVLLPSPAWYVGLLGPRSRSERLLEALAAGGSPATREQLAGLHARLHAPVGLDLGAESPEEIATAVVAEIVAARRGGAGAPLREKAGPIHGPAGGGELAPVHPGPNPRQNPDPHGGWDPGPKDPA